MIANLISNKLVPTQWTLNKNPKNKNLKSNSTKIDMWRHKSSKHDRIMVLSTQTCQSVCVCARARIKFKSVQTRAKCKNTYSYVVSRSKKHDYPYNFCIPQNPKRRTKTSMRHFIMNMICKTQHKNCTKMKYSHVKHVEQALY